MTAASTSAEPHDAPGMGTHDGDTPCVIGVVDAQWLVAHVSPTVEGALGCATDDVVGRPLEALVHPDDVAALLTAMGTAARDGRADRTDVRWRCPEGGWQPLRVVVTPLAGTSVPRFAFAVLGAPDDQLAGAMLPRLQLAALSPREREIVHLLLRGERVPSIARNLYLAQSTVRNHLSSVFRKLGVHSQQELVHRLRDPEAAARALDGPA